jgi:hypothetical protein
MGKLELVAVESGDIIAPGEELAAIADRIRDRMRRQVKDIVAIGADLIVVKAMLGHGTFGDWLKREFRLSVRSAQLYMTAAKWAEDKSEIISHLPLEALRMLSAPTTPEPIRDEVVEAIRAGVDVDFKSVGVRIRDERAAIVEAQRQEERKRARLQGKSPEYQRKLERQMAREAAERQQTIDTAVRLRDEARAILQKLPAEDLNRLREIGAVQWLSLKELVEGLESARDDAADRLAAEFGVSREQIIEDGHFAAKVDAVAATDPEAARALRAGDPVEDVDDEPHPDAPVLDQLQALIAKGTTDAATFANKADVAYPALVKFLEGKTISYHDVRKIAAQIGDTL